MMEYEQVAARMRELRESAERARRAAEAMRAKSPLLAPLRLAAGTRLARLGLRLAGPAALRLVLGESR